MKYSFIVFFLFFLQACSPQETPDSNRKVIEIAARDDGLSLERPVIYSIKVPLSWVQKNTAENTSIIDTKISLIEYFIQEDNEKVRISIHNFPSDQLNKRIPPLAQVTRWKKQFHSLDPTTVKIIPQAFGGYAGYLLEAQGHFNGLKTAILAWALQLAPEHYQALSYPSPLLRHKFREMRADVTIKATGSPHLIQKYRDELISFARSFQLIDDIP